jgi:hypothetical protein
MIILNRTLCCLQVLLNDKTKTLGFLRVNHFDFANVRACFKGFHVEPVFGVEFERENCTIGISPGILNQLL